MAQVIDLTEEDEGAASSWQEEPENTGNHRGKLVGKAAASSAPPSARPSATTGASTAHGFAELEHVESDLAKTHDHARLERIENELADCELQIQELLEQQGSLRTERDRLMRQMQLRQQTPTKRDWAGAFAWDAKVCMSVRACACTLRMQASSRA